MKRLIIRIMKKTEISEIQKQFWILQHLYPDTTAYNIPYLAVIGCKLNLEALGEAINVIVSRHEMLRTRFTEENGKIFQSVMEKEQARIRIDVIKINGEFIKGSLSEETYEEIHKPFNLNDWPFIRVKLFVYSNTTVLTIVIHHIIIDLVSANIFFNELSELYKSACLNSVPDLKEPVNNYFDYSDEINEWLSTESAERKIEEWKSYIPVRPSRLEFPTALSRTGINKTTGKRLHVTVDNVLSSEISAFAVKNFVSDFIVMLSAYAILLNKLCNQAEITIGVPFKNRAKNKYDKTFGCFVNILPLLVNFSDDLTGKALLKQVLGSLLRIERKEQVPYLLLNSLLGQGDGTGLFQAGFTFDPSVKLELSGADARLQLIERAGSQLDLFFTLWERDGKYNAFLEYSNNTFDEEVIRRYWKIYCTILKSVIDDPDQLVGAIDIAPAEDIDLVSSINKTEVKYEDNLCIHEKFERQVEKTPDATALLFNDRTLSYREFNEHANMMANRLIKDGIKVEDVVCICMERSVEMMIGIYGVLKAGAVYLPLNPDTPVERLSTIISDAHPKLILTTKESSLNIPKGNPQLYIDDLLTNPVSEDISKPKVNVNSRNLAYIIYTSGSTGVPKGVMIEHHSVLNRLGWMQRAYPIDHSDTLIQKTPVTFDVSVWELFWWSFNGSRLALLPAGGEKIPETILQNIEKYKVTTIHFVPSLFIAFLGVLKSRSLFGGLNSLRRVFMSGEALPMTVVEEFNENRTKFKLPEIINLYGPTEATVDVSYYNCPSSNVKQVYIGKPIDNTRLFVVNGKRKLQPVGVPGELLITGVNLARGYLNHQELTDERFVDFTTPDGEIIKAYRTGDLVKMTAEGEIDYIGRIDNQVKIRGFRIELGDIEAQIHKYPDVINCAVIVSEDMGSKSLVAYICLKKGVVTEADAIRKFLLSKLPDYMVPSFFVFLEELPLTTSGKLNRKALPRPERVTSGDTIALPTNNCEKILLRLWKDLLRIENISINDNFFEIGGNSLLAINLATLISKEFNILINTITVLEYPNIKGQSDYIAGLTGKKDNSDQNISIDDKAKQRKDVDFQRRRI